MGDPATTMRDPLFYRWHGFIDDVFVLYKNKLPPYGNDRVTIKISIMLNSDVKNIDNNDKNIFNIIVARQKYFGIMLKMF